MLLSNTLLLLCITVSIITEMASDGRKLNGGLNRKHDVVPGRTRTRASRQMCGLNSQWAQTPGKTSLRSSRGQTRSSRGPHRSLICGVCRFVVKVGLFQTQANALCGAHFSLCGRCGAVHSVWEGQQPRQTEKGQQTRASELKLA